MTDGPIAWIFLIVGLVFIFGGSKRLADLGKGFGSFMKEFNKAKREGEGEEAKLEQQDPKKIEPQAEEPKQQ